DPSGNRTYKEVIRRDIGNYSQDIVDRTYYVRDAQGNTMATYSRHEESGNTPSLKWSEQHLYGSSRLGVKNLNLDILAQTTVPQVNQTLVDSLHTGHVVYELTNHLGNVMATISDKKLFSNIVIPETGAAAFYYPEVLSQTDYYAFGQEIKERAYRISGGYRYGFNGKENDSEVKGEGNQQDYGFRIFDPRLGRFLSVDPLYREYTMLSTYQFAGNRPIVAIDLEGLEPQEHPYSLKATGKPQLGVTKEGKIYEAYQVNSPTYGNGKQWVARIKEEIPNQNGMSMKPIDHYLYFNNEANEWQNWQRGDEPSIRHKQTTELANGIGVGFFGAAVIGTGLPVLGEFAPLAQSYFSTAINAQMSTRIASTSSDVIMQYISNFPEYGFGRNNFERINLSSVALNFAAPGSNLIPAVGGSGLEFNLANGYQGLGSGNKSLGNFLLQSTIGIGGNYMGNKLEGVFSKYTNAGSFLNTFTGETLGNGTANNVQFIFNQMNKNDETPK
ncbi:MAG: RHS repeat domain-containing protein, partial [Chitinophagaceae bacterium]